MKKTEEYLNIKKSMLIYSNRSRIFKRVKGMKEDTIISSKIGNKIIYDIDIEILFYQVKTELFSSKFNH